MHSFGPNYNQGHTHNAEKENRMKIVYKEDARMKKAMIRARKLAAPKANNRSKSKLRRIIK